jgi:hypothetical protein
MRRAGCPVIQTMLHHPPLGAIVAKVRAPSLLPLRRYNREAGTGTGAVHTQCSADPPLHWPPISVQWRRFNLHPLAPGVARKEIQAQQSKQIPDEDENEWEVIAEYEVIEWDIVAKKIVDDT